MIDSRDYCTPSPKKQVLLLWFVSDGCFDWCFWDTLRLVTKKKDSIPKKCQSYRKKRTTKLGKLQYLKIIPSPNSRKPGHVLDKMATSSRCEVVKPWTPQLITVHEGASCTANVYTACLWSVKIYV